LASREFVNSERICRFLRFTVEQTLAGKAGRLKEYAIGVEVFDKGSGFDPRIDPIVRVEARRLRSKLKAYYLRESTGGEISIDLPKGAYVPVFRAAGERAASTGSTVAGPPPARPVRNVAVLPFANISSDRENEYFSDGLAEELIHALTKVEGLHVVAAASAFRFKGKGHDVCSIGEQLNVGTLLEGSVRRVGNRLRVTVQLIDTLSGSYLWSETYQREMQDVFAIQDEISRSVVNKLRIGLSAEAGGPYFKRYTGNLNAYSSYLKGRYCWNQRTEERLLKGIEYFRQAITEDENYAPAYVGLADSCMLLGQYGMLMPSEVMPKAKAAAERALSIDDALSEAHASLGLLQSLYDWDWVTAEQHFRRAIELNPGYATAHHWYAIDHLAVLGRFDEALAEIRRALEIDPLSLITNINLGDILLYRDERELALAQYLKTLELDPAFYRTWWDLGWAYEQNLRFEEAVQAYNSAQSLSGGNLLVLGDLGHCYAQWGNQAQARELLAELQQRSKQRYVSPASIALIHFGLGEIDQGFRLLDRAFDERDCRLLWLKQYPGQARRDPRFAALERRMGLI
jgi:serine/threonine-protein kinase